jgi:hypothetical protein
VSGSPSPDVRARILAEARRIPAPTTLDRQRGTAIAAVAAAIVSLLLVVWLAWDSDRGPRALAADGLLGFAAAFGATWIAASRGRSTVGRSGRLLLAVVLLSPLLVLASGTAVTVWHGGTIALGGRLRVHVLCAALTLLLAVAPFAALLYARRRTDLVHPRLLGAALGAAAGAWAGAMMGAMCEVTTVEHMALAHALPSLFVAGLGALLGARVLRVPV